jgi:hypothetical protein
LVALPHALLAHVPDSADPQRTGCGSDAITLDLQQVSSPPDTTLGTLEMRYSARCAAGWGRFTPNVGKMDPLGPAIVTVEATRQVDGATAPWSAPYVGVQMFGNLLHTGPGCVLVRVYITFGRQQTASAATSCHRQP